jgi:hypothetical protein
VFLSRKSERGGRRGQACFRADCWFAHPVGYDRNVAAAAVGQPMTTDAGGTVSASAAAAAGLAASLAKQTALREAQAASDAQASAAALKAAQAVAIPVPPPQTKEPSSITCEPGVSTLYAVYFD